jgi:hypothetical protein
MLASLEEDCKRTGYARGQRIGFGTHELESEAGYCDRDGFHLIVPLGYFAGVDF